MARSAPQNPSPAANRVLTAELDRPRRTVALAGSRWAMGIPSRKRLVGNFTERHSLIGCGHDETGPLSGVVSSLDLGRFGNPEAASFMCASRPWRPKLIGAVQLRATLGGIRKRRSEKPRCRPQEGRDCV
jgi:hypothetical protein